MQSHSSFENKVAGLIKEEAEKAKISDKFEEIDEERDTINLNNNSYVGFFFINTCNGKVQISGGNEIDSVENRFVTFPSNTAYFHSSHTDKKFKLFLKIVYIPE